MSTHGGKLAMSLRDQCCTQDLGSEQSKSGTSIIIYMVILWVGGSVYFMIVEFNAIFTHKRILFEIFKLMCDRIELFFQKNIYDNHKNASSNMSRFEAHAGHFRLLMKGHFDAYVL